MKKILTILSFMFITILIGCQEDVRFADVLELIPDTYEENLELPTQHKDQDLTYKIHDQVIEDSILVYQFSYDDLNLELTIIIDGVHEVKKSIINKASRAVSNLYIETNDGSIIDSKKDYKTSTISISSDHGFSQDDLTARVRGRGNSTWFLYPKKPYRIKFDERTSLLGMASAKDYVLLAEFGDKSLLRNFVGHKLSDLTGVSYTLDYRYVNLYINHQYEGLYMLTEQVEIDKNRLNIDESETSNAFFLELEDWTRIESGDEENYEYIVFGNRALLVESPALRDIEDDHTRLFRANQIKSYLTGMYQSFKTNQYTNYIDEESFINYFIVQEITKNVVINFSSVFMYKDHNEPLKMGPLWDFDISLGNGDYYDYLPERFYATHNFIFNELIKNQVFKQKYIARFKEVIEAYQEPIQQEIDLMYERLRVEALKNFRKWDIMNTYWWPNTPPMMDATTHEEQVNYLKTWLNERMQWIYENLDAL